VLHSVRRAGVAAVLGIALALSGCGSDPSTNQALKHACYVVDAFPNDYIPNHWVAYADRIAHVAATMRDPTRKAVLTRLAQTAHAFAAAPQRVDGPAADRYFNQLGVLEPLCDNNGTPMLP
jgi:hypothetical protein